MVNLAGVKECDVIITDELRVCRIEHVKMPAKSGREVNASVEGKLGPFRFVRAWRYWVVTGPMPLQVAEALYLDPLGRRDVRVNGDCTAPAPTGRARCHWTADRKPYPIIASYHIDSEAGLRLFADTVIAAGLDRAWPAITAWNDDATDDIVRHFAENPGDVASSIGEIVLKHRGIYCDVNWDDPRLVALCALLTANHEAPSVANGPG